MKIFLINSLKKYAKIIRYFSTKEQDPYCWDFFYKDDATEKYLNKLKRFELYLYFHQ